MELIKKLFSDASDTEFKLAQDLVAIAMADGAISEQERRVIINICQQEGIVKESINDFMQGYDDDVYRLMPEERKGIEGRFSDRIFCQKTDSPVEYLIRIDITADPVRSAHDGEG